MQSREEFNNAMELPWHNSDILPKRNAFNRSPRKAALLTLTSDASFTTHELLKEDRVRRCLVLQVVSSASTLRSSRKTKPQTSRFRFASVCLFSNGPVGNRLRKKRKSPKLPRNPGRNNLCVSLRAAEITQSLKLGS